MKDINKLIRYKETYAPSAKQVLTEYFRENRELPNIDELESINVEDETDYVNYWSENSFRKYSDKTKDKEIKELEIIVNTCEQELLAAQMQLAFHSGDFRLQKELDRESLVYANERKRLTAELKQIEHSNMISKAIN